MSRGEEIALEAMKKEHCRLSKIAEKAKKEADACCNVGSEMLSIYDELKKIIDSKEVGRHILNRLDALQKRERAAKKLMGVNISAVFDRQFKAEQEVTALAGEISGLQYRLNLRKPNRAG